MSIEPDDVDLVQEVSTGWGVASEGGVTVALDLEVTEELRREGLARDLIRVVQDARKSAGLDVTDRIRLGVEAGPVVAAALAAHREAVAGETLALEVRDVEVDPNRVDTSIEGEAVRISLVRFEAGGSANA